MNIVVAYNGSEPAKRALELAKTHAKAFDAVVTILISMYGDVDQDSSPSKIESFWTDVIKAEKELAKLRENFEKESIKCSTHVMARGGDPGEDILDFADQVGADEIIIGIEKKSKVGKLLFGSTAQKVILEAKCPVITVS